MRHAGLVKLLLFAFMVLAVYNYDKAKIKSVIKDASQQISKISSIIKEEDQSEPEDNSNIKIGIEKKRSYIEKKMTNVIRSALKTPEGKEIIQTVVNRLSKENPKIQQLLTKKFFIEEIELGSGPSAKCGQEIEISYFTRAITKSNKSTSPLSNKKIITLGEGSIPIPLEQALIGMKKNSNRHITYSQEKIDFLPKEDASLFYYSDVTLLEILPKNLQKFNKQVFTKNTNNANTTGIRKFNCGENITMHYTIYNLDNKLLYDSKNNKVAPGTLRIGSSKLPYEITVALEELPVTQQLFIIVPRNELTELDFLIVPDNLNITEEIVLLSLNPSSSK